MHKKKKILIPLPSYGFDPTEVAIPWKLLTAQGFDVVFATPRKEVAEADKIMLTGKGLGIFSSVLKARKDAVIAYTKMLHTDEFKKPISYKEIDVQNFDSIFLPGGHDKGVKEYLESQILQNHVLSFFNNNKKVGAICHGVVLLAKSINPQTNKSVIYDYKTTSLLKSQELLAYKLTKFWLKDYYLTYPELTVENEVTSVLKSENQYIKGPKPVFRDSEKDIRKGFSIRDRNYISARWPGDIYNFTFKYIKMLLE